MLDARVIRFTGPPEQTALVSPLASRDFIFMVPDGYVPRRITAKAPTRDLLLTQASHIVQGRVVVTIWNRATFARAIKLGISDRGVTESEAGAEAEVSE